MVVCMLLCATPFTASAQAEEKRDLKETLMDNLGIPEEVAGAVTEGDTVPENFASTVAYVTNYNELSDALNDHMVSIVLIMNNIQMEPQGWRYSPVSKALIAPFPVTVTSAASSPHLMLDTGMSQDVVYTFSNVTLDGNRTGGGVHVTGNHTSSSKFEGLQLTGCSDQSGYAYAFSGHNISLNECGITGNHGGADLSGSVQAQNSSFSENAGIGLYYHSYTGSLSVDRCSFTGNSENGLYIQSQHTEPFFSDISDSTFNGNGSSAVAKGGGILFEGSGTAGSSLAVLGDTVISENRAVDGGGIYVENAGFVIDGSDFPRLRYNTAYRGGAIFLKDTSYANLSAYIEYNLATVQGGGIYAAGGSASSGAEIMLRGEVACNEARFQGGGIYLEPNFRSLTGPGTIQYNTAFYHGGGVFASTGTNIYPEVSNNTSELGTGADIWYN